MLIKKKREATDNEILALSSLPGGRRCLKLSDERGAVVEDINGLLDNDLENVARLDL